MPKGGKRPGAGLKKGYKFAHTLEKTVERERLRAIVAPRFESLILAQVSNAEGIKYLVTRDKKSGKFIRVTEAMAKAKQGQDNEETIEVWEKDPSVYAFADLMNRYLDKPKEQEIEVKHDGRLEIVVKKPW